MTTMALFLSPVDVWLFRDGRPFDAGDDHYARSLFPPYPSVTQGAIRSHHLVVKGVDLRNRHAIEAAVGTADDFGNLRMRGPFIARRNTDGTLTRCFPTPADALPWKNGRLKVASPQPAANFRVVTSADRRLPLLFFSHPDIEAQKREPGGWLSEDQLRRCLSGEPVEPVSAETLFTFEHRYGIELDSDRRATQEGRLYGAEFIRPCEGVGLYLEVSGYDDWPETGVMRLGGESRGARFEQVEVMAWPAPPDPLPARFKVYFASPAYFTEGWRPQSWNRFFDGDVTLQAVALRGYETRGGYDLAGNSQKPARRYVPAGSMYYFESKGSVRLRPDLIQNAVTEYGAEIGFGQVWISAW